MPNAEAMNAMNLTHNACDSGGNYRILSICIRRPVCYGMVSKEQIKIRCNGENEQKSNQDLSQYIFILFWNQAQFKGIHKRNYCLNLGQLLNI